MEKETNIIIARRVPPSDRWRLTEEDSEGKIHNSLTEVLEAYFQKTQTRCEFRLAPLKGELYAITTEEVAPPPLKTFNLYDEY